jgi:nucleoside-diphosphate-sugar epimerase
VSRTLFCFGLGYTARALADTLVPEGWQVAGTAREGSGAVLPFDGETPVPGLDGILQRGAALLVSIPPGEAGDRVLAVHGHEIAAHAARIPWVGLLSTTGVYGDRAGGWVDEASDTAPTSRRGRLRVLAEQQWLALWREHGLPVHIFRLAGIYGPGRNPLARLRAGDARVVVKPGQVFSRIHVADIAQVLRASLARPDPGAAYNVCDDEAAPPQDVVAYAARLLGLEPPPGIPFEDAEMTAMARSFYEDNRRVRNDRIKRDLGVRLLYPDYRTGLDALFAAVAY